MPLAVRLLNGGIVGVLVRDEERGLDVAAVGVLALPAEHLLVQLDVVVVDGVIEGDGDHLGYVLGRQVAGDGRTVLGAETVGQHANGRVAGGGAVRVVVDICEMTSVNSISGLSNGV